MPTLVSDIINEAFLDLAVIQPGESITPSMQADAFLRLNQLLGSLSAEGASVFNQVIQSFALAAGQAVYTLGAAGTWATTGGLRAQKVTGWKAVNGAFASGGAPLSFDAFGGAAREAEIAFQTAAAQAAAIEADMAAKVSAAVAPFFISPVFAYPALTLANSAVPIALAADTAYPLINIRVFPAPAAAPGNVELSYWTPITAFAAVSDALDLPPGYEEMLHFNLAVKLYSQYARQGGIPAELAANAQNSKASIVQQIAGNPPSQK